MISQASFHSPHLIISIRVQDRRETARYFTQIASLPDFGETRINLTVLEELSGLMSQAYGLRKGTDFLENLISYDKEF